MIRFERGPMDRKEFRLDPCPPLLQVVIDHTRGCLYRKGTVSDTYRLVRKLPRDPVVMHTTTPTVLYDSRRKGMTWIIRPQLIDGEQSFRAG